MPTPSPTRPATQKRVYRGHSAEERRAIRRDALIEAGRELWTEQGWDAVTMRGACARASLSDRYFYESFADRDALLVAVSHTVRDETLALLLSAVAAHDADPVETKLRAALVAIVDSIVHDPGNTQIFFGDQGGSDALEALRRETIGAVLDLALETARPHLLPDVDETDVRVTLLVGIGGFVETATAWRSGGLDLTGEELIETLMRTSRRLGHGFFASAATGPAPRAD